MSLGSGNLLLAAGGDTGYNLTRSLRFRASASGYLSRTNTGTVTNNAVWTWSAWVKIGYWSPGNAAILFGNGAAGSANECSIKFTNNQLEVINYVSSVVQSRRITTQVFRDPSAWYHFVVSSNSSTSLNLYVNGVQITAFGTSTGPSAAAWALNTASTVTNIGFITSAQNFDGHMAEVNFIDGQALTPSSFGSTNALTGVWQPARYTGTYGTNGFYLPFTDNSALTTSSNVGLGKDFSGNGNYWTTNNISITAGVTYDSMTDVPTLTSATAANFATFNPLSAETGMNGTLTAGNLTLSNGGGKRTTIAVRTGKWYWEYTVTSGATSNFPMCGIYVAGAGTYWPGYDGNSFGYFQGGGIYYNGSTSLTVSSYTNGDILGFAWDADTGKVWVAKNGTWQNSGNPTAGTGQVATISTGVDRVVGAYDSAGSSSINFGQRPFNYTPPTGFACLNTFNLPDSTIKKGNTVMDATLYTGTLLSNAVTNAASFRPDLVWIKSRSAATGHEWTDSVRGVTKSLSSNSTAAEATDVQGLTAFNTNGFTVGTNTDYNNLAATYVAWQWQAGQGSTSSNTNGTITSTVSVNASAGFSVVTYTGTGANATVGHGLGVAPSLVIVKVRSTTNDWVVYHSAIGNTGAVFLDLTNATGTSVNYWNNTSPTSSNFSIGIASGVNNSGSTFVAYCWTPIAGYSAFGSYTGNGSADGPFVYTGFRPKWILVKRTDTTNNWCVYDTSRNPYNLTNLALYPDGSFAEGTETTNVFDLLSNGIKARGAGNAVNASGGTYIYMAFAENPFKNALAR